MIAARVAAASEPQATTTTSLSSGSSSTTSTTGKLLTGLASWLSPSEASEEDTGQVVCRYLGAPGSWRRRAAAATPSGRAAVW